jgi:transcription termination factor Rho
MMNDDASTATEVASDAPANERVPLPETLDLVELQKLAPAELEALCAKYDVRMHAGRSRHHHILDFARWAISSGVRLTTHGFFDILADSFGVLRCPALNFLPVPEDVGVPRRRCSISGFDLAS